MSDPRDTQVPATEAGRRLLHIDQERTRRITNLRLRHWILDIEAAARLDAAPSVDALAKALHEAVVPYAQPCICNDVMFWHGATAKAILAALAATEP